MRGAGALSTKKRIQLAFAVFSAICASTTAARASPWVRAAGEFLFISRGELFNAALDPVETPSGLVSANFSRFESDAYVEYGATRRFTIGGKARYGSTTIQRGAERDTASGVSEIEAFTQYQLLRSRRHAAALRISASKNRGLQSGARNELQNTGFDTEIAALYGQDVVLEPVNIYWAVEAGYRKRFGDAADQIKSTATIGVEPHQRLLLLLETFSTTSLRNETGGGSDFDVVKIQPSVLFRLNNRWALQAGLSKEPIVRNLQPGRTYFISLWNRF